MKILIVEDEIKTGEYLSKGLTEAGFVVDHADNGLTGYHLAMTAEYDLVILDIMLPDVNGWDIIRMLRSAGKGMPVLLLTALGTIEHRVKGLELGADDYLVKPFYQQELLARVKALLRRYDALGSIRETHTESRLQVGDIALDLDTKQLLVRGDAVRVTPTEYKILRMLLANPGHVFSSEEIYSRVWDREAYAVENTVMVHISRIREKLEVNPKKPEYLKVVWGIGYVLEAP
ncbi:response regulator [Hafnia paralvei]|uniref:response regulator n=1 Tax=Hafnia paralvei TaxID=546367 RepID=UPI0024A8B48E|nr:response regulator [Hafnia paralvei]